MKKVILTTMKKVIIATISLLFLLMGSAAYAGESTTLTQPKPITEAEVQEAQKVWGDGIIAIGNAFTHKEDYKALAATHVDTLYAYDEGTVLFKPTRAAAQQFRLSEPEAVSYFVTGVVPEDRGFALQPWSAVRFENAGILIDDDSAVAMGNYFFTDANTGKEAKAEFTLGYVRGEDGKLLIDVHHSAFPYNPSR